MGVTDPAYLDLHPPARSQFRCPRREDPSGVAVVHTAESVMDTVGVDTGAEAVARFIRGRAEPGSYHDLVDSDSWVRVVRWECEAFQDATGSNPHGYGLSFACSYLDWTKMSKARRDAFVERGARAAAAWARWVRTETGIVVPARRITRAQSEARVPGFIAHAERDPARRKDPGLTQFPWTQFLRRFAVLSTPTPPSPEEDDDMRSIVKGDERPEVFITDGIHKRHVDDWGEGNVLIYGDAAVAKIAAPGKPFVWPQAVVDDLRTV